MRKLLPILAIFLPLLFALPEMEAQTNDVPYTIGEEKVVTEEELIRRGDKLKAYRVIPDVGEVIRTTPDTASTLFYKRSAADYRSLSAAYVGNIHSPWLSATFFDREAEPPSFMYRTGFSQIMYSPKTALFYDTKTPFTEVFYQRHGSVESREEHVSTTFGTNLGRHFNFGADFDLTYSNGYYEAQRTRNVSYRVFGSYRSDRYEANAYIANDYYKIVENGGITDETYITEPESHGTSRGSLNSKDVPVRFPGDVLYNRLRSGQAFLSHRYNLGQMKQGKTSDDYLGGNGVGGRDTTYFISVASINHYLTFRKDSRRFIGKEGYNWLDAYPEYHITRPIQGRKDVMEVVLPDGTTTVLTAPFDTTTVATPNDTTRMWQVNNTIALSLREGFRPWVKFGLTGYARLENRSFYQMDSIPESVPRINEFSLFVGAEISRQEGEKLNFRARAEVAALGSDVGAFRANGEVSSRFSLWGRDVGLRAWGNFTNLRPSYFVRHHHGTFHWWDEEFAYTRHLEFGGLLSSERLGISLSARTATLQNYIYYTASGKPKQHGGAVQVVEFRGRAHKRFGAFAYDVEAAYQASTNQDVLPLPALSLYANLYLDFHIVKVLHVQAGVDARYHTAYHAPYYEPATQQFLNQQETLIGGKAPLLTAYINAKLKRTRFFIELYNFGDLFIPSNRFTLAAYPRSPMSLRIGLSIDFNN